jgi:phospholipid-binding lipoprotein MlaA
VGIRNVFHNAAMPVRFVNALLQGKPKIAGYEFGRCFVNTMVGLGGWFDVASREPELRSYDEDLGQTFGMWGLGHGFYLVWPLLGPSSLRDTFGMVGDGFMDPIVYFAPPEALLGIGGYAYLNAGSLRIGDYEDLKDAAIDPYTAMRDAYYQRRKAEVTK